MVKVKKLVIKVEEIILVKLFKVETMLLLLKLCVKRCDQQVIFIFNKFKYINSLIYYFDNYKKS